MSDFDTAIDTDQDEAPTSYSSSTPGIAPGRKGVLAPGGGTGRRKEAVARVRLVPGSGKWIVNREGLDVHSHFID